MLKEFKEFIAHGNVMELAVGVIVGFAFTAIIKSLISNIINPLIRIFAGKIDFYQSSSLSAQPISGLECS